MFRNVIEATKLLIEEEEGIMFHVRLFLRQDRWRACVVMMAGPEACLFNTSMTSNLMDPISHFRLPRITSPTSCCPHAATAPP